MQIKNFKTLAKFAAGLLFGAGFAFSMAHAEYPNRPIRLIVSYAPGGASDNVARTLGAKLAERWKQSIVVDNRPGGNTVISALE